MKKLKYIIILLVMLNGIVAQAQDKKPVDDEQDIKKKLFHLDKRQYNHSFSITLPDDNFLLIDFYRMSYWPDSSDLQNICDIAANAVEQVQPSFDNDQTSKFIGVHIPEKDRPVTVMSRENNDGSELVVISKGTASPLKVGMDTVRVLKTYKTVKDPLEETDVLAQVQYTFILKDLSDMDVLANNKAVIYDVINTLDSVIHQKRNKWKKQDTWYHKIGITYKPMERESKDKLKVTNPSYGIVKAFDFGYYIGAALYRNDLVPSLEVGLSYKFPVMGHESFYTRASLVTLTQFERATQSRFDMYYTGFICAEIGSIVDRPNSGVPIYTTSLGLGYMISDHPVNKSHTGYKLFFHYGVTPTLRVTLDFYGLKNDRGETDAWSGITFAMKLF